MLQRASFITSMVALSCLCIAQKPISDWLPVTPQDLQIKEVPNRPGDAAIQLYFSYYKDDDARFVSVYRRIKVLNEAGKKYADVEIPVDPDDSLKEVKARTIQPDGTPAEFHGKIFEKTIFKARGVKYAARTFTMPDVKVGSIIEYRYTIELPPGVVRRITEWPIQGDLFTVHEDLRFRAYQGLVMTALERNSAAPKSRVAYAYLNQIDARLPEKKKGNLMELELDNVPPFDAEEYMPPAADYKPTLLFYYGGRETASPEDFWREWQKAIAEYVEKFIGSFGEIHEAALQAMGSETDAEQKLRKLYTRAQQIRNLSYERERTREENKREHIKESKSAREVLQRGYGTSWEIDAVFAALARSAGFDATMLGVTDRSERSFNDKVLSLSLLDGEAVLVKVGGKDVVLDPGTRFLPYGMLPWNRTSTQAMRFSNREGPEFITTPAPEISPMHRSARMAVSADGSAKGDITIELQGQEALEHRLDALSTDEAGRRKSLEDEVSSWLPNGAVVKMVDSSGWNREDAPLSAHFEVTVPDYASLAGKRLIVPAFLFSTLQKGMFTAAGRRYPIVFSYPFSESDEVAIKLPQGYSMEQPPYRRKAGLSFAGYQIESDVGENMLTTKRALHLDQMNFPPEQYDELKSFFKIVLAGDGGDAVSHAGGS
jgi:hypothetical protein